LKNFQSFVAIDWSGAKAPVHTRAIQVAACLPGAGPPDILLPGGRALWSRDAVFAWIMARAVSGPRTLVGIDANFGYAQAIGEAQFGAEYDYRDLWDAVEDSNPGIPNFFAGGYWTHPLHGRHFWTDGTMPGNGFTMPRRVTEEACGSKGFGWPESPFKLIGAKQVGKGGLSAMRLAHALKAECGDSVAFWPFERRLSDTARVVVSEIYPRLFLRRAGHGNAKIRTFSGLRACLSQLGCEPAPGKEGEGALSDHTADALAAAAGLRFCCGRGRDVPDTIANPPAPENILMREGWIFGV